MTPEAADSAYVALALVPGVGPARLRSLLAEFGSADSVLRASAKALAAVPRISPAAATAIASVTPQQGFEVCQRVEALGGTVLTPESDTFPAALRCIPEVPPLLFVQGRLELLDRPCVAVVGSRDHTAYGEAACRYFAAELARHGLVVVSGMARGLDAVAHWSALEVGGDSVGVLGNGFGVVYPAANRDLYQAVAARGCLITEYPPGERPHAGSFPRRNRLISGLSKVTVVVEARVGSGALITVDCALGQGREVMAVPGPFDSAQSVGTHRLIQQGAKLVLTPRDVLEEYDIDPATPPVTWPSDLSAIERTILESLVDDVSVDEIADAIGGPAAEVLAALTSLEIRGLVGRLAGSRFRRTTPAGAVRSG